MVDFAKLKIETQRRHMVTAIAVELHTADRCAAGPVAPAAERERALALSRLVERERLYPGDTSEPQMPAVRYWREMEAQVSSVLAALNAAGYTVVAKEPL